MNEINPSQNAQASATAADKTRARQTGDAAAVASANAASPGAGAGQPNDRSTEAHPTTRTDRTGATSGKPAGQANFDRYVASFGPAAQPDRPADHHAVDAGRSPTASHEKGDGWQALYPELRAQLAPLGVTVDQARTYAQLVNTGTERGDQQVQLQTPDMQRVGHMINLLPEKLRLDLFAQVAKPGDQPTKPDAAGRAATAADATGAGADSATRRITVDTKKLSAEQSHFGFDPPLTKPETKEKAEQLAPMPKPTSYFAPSPAKEPTRFEKDQARPAAPESPSHRAPDVSPAGDPAEAMRADFGKFVEAFKGTDGGKRLRSFIEHNVDRLPPALGQHPAAAVAAIGLAAPIILTAITGDNAAQHRPVIGAPDQTPNGPIDPTGAINQLLDMRLASVGGLAAFNQLIGLIKLPGDGKASVDFSYNLSPAPPKDYTGPRQPSSNTFFGLNLDWDF